MPAEPNARAAGAQPAAIGGEPAAEGTGLKRPGAVNEGAPRHRGESLPERAMRALGASAAAYRLPQRGFVEEHRRHMDRVPLADDRAPRSPTPGSSPADDERNAMRDLWAAVLRRKRLIAGTALAVFALAAAFIMSMPPVYRASSTVLIETRRVPKVTAEGATEAPIDADTVANELQILQSRELLGRAVRHLGLERDPAFNRDLLPSRFAALADAAGAAQRWLPEPMARVAQGLAGLLAAEAAPDGQATTDAAVDGLLRRLRIGPVGRSRAIQITAEAPSPGLAATLANTVAELYIAHQTARREEETRKVNAWLNDRVGELRAKADASARAVAEFRATQRLVRGVARGDREADIVQQEISEVASQLTAARARRAEAAGRLDEAERAGAAGNADALAAVLGSQTVQQLRIRESQAAARQADLAVRLGPGHPDAAAAKAESADVRGRIAGELQRILASVRTELRFAQETESRLGRRLEELRTEVARLGAVEVRLQELQREAEADRALVGNFIARARETSPQASGFEAASARLVSRAAVPRRPSAPQKRILLPLALLASLGVGGLTALVAEARGRGFRSMDDVERFLGLRALGILPLAHRARDRALAEDAVADLCARVLSPANGAPPRSLLVTSALPEEGKTTTAAAVARAAARRGVRALLVRADLRRAEACGRGAELGLADVLRGEAPLKGVIREDPGTGLSILPPGRVSAGEAVRLLTSDAMARTLREIERAFDLAVVDAAPVLVGTDTWRLARGADEILFLVRWRRTPRPAVATALRQLSAAGGRVPGVVLSMVDTRKNARYGHGDAAILSPAIRRHYSAGWAERPQSGRFGPRRALVPGGVAAALLVGSVLLPSNAVRPPEPAANGAGAAIAPTGAAPERLAIAPAPSLAATDAHPLAAQAGAPREAARPGLPVLGEAAETPPSASRRTDPRR